ncbi:MAG TPA: glycosyltransferase family 39 protein [Terriglobales bacterium]|nr:glycosyltransferase family 39 protein [Terriglobales bacterium]
MQSPAVVFVTALSMRLWAASRLSPEEAWRYFYGYNEFARIAWAMVSGFGYSSPWPHTPLLPTAVEPPVYAVLLSGIFKMAGAYSFRSLWIAIGFNAVLSSIAAVLLLRIGQSRFGSPVGILAAWVWSCWLYEAAVAVRLWESSLSALLLLLGLLWLPKLAGTLRPAHWAGFGALAGLGALTNTSLIAVFPFFLVWLFIQHRRQKRSCGLQLATAIGICILVMMPWTIRNYLTFHRWMPVRDNFGLELWLGNHEGVGSRFETFPIVNPEEYNRLGEIRFMETERELAVQFIRRHPAEFLGRCAKRVFRYWTEPRGSVWPFVSFLAWIGLALAFHGRQWDVMPHGIALLCFPVAYYITHTFPTYRHVIEPSVILMASYTVVSAGTALENRMRQGSSEREVGVPGG